MKAPKKKEELAEKFKSVKEYLLKGKLQRVETRLDTGFRMRALKNNVLEFH